MSTPPPLCPQCQAPIAPDAPGGLCPACVLRGVAQADSGPAAAPALAPSLEEVGAAFPELEMLELLGRGGMGVVFKARQPRLDRLVALKILPPELARQPGFAERFTREARALARLSHPHIVAVYDFGERAGFYYLLMEFVSGLNLRDAMRAGITPAQALLLVPRICDALQFAHDHGVLHRDIKPENILLDTAGTPKLADFGIAKLADEPATASGLTQTGAQLGTAAYMAPEQIEKPATVDHRADIYSLGVVLYEMLTGELPLGRFAPPSDKAAVGGKVDDVVFRALEKERERRQQSATQMKSEVEGARAEAGRPVAAVAAPHPMAPKEKDLGIAYLFWYLLGLAGGHRFYLGQIGWGLLYLCTAGLFFIGWIVDLFTLPSQVRRHNEHVRLWQSGALPPLVAVPPRDPWPLRIVLILIAVFTIGLGFYVWKHGRFQGQFDAHAPTLQFHFERK